MVKERKKWHKIFQEMLENNENLKDLSGKIILEKSKEHQKTIRADFICHVESNIPKDQLKPIARPLSHFKKRNIIEYKSFHEVLNNNMFRYYVGRALCAENCDEIKYSGVTTLTIITLHKPISVLSVKKYKFEKITPWKYRSCWDDELEVYVLVQSEMRGLKEGEALALLQVIESQENKQKPTWKSIFEQDLENKDTLEKIAKQISEEEMMSLVEEIKMERNREIALEMLKDQVEIAKIIKFTKLSEKEVFELKQKLENSK